MEALASDLIAAAARGMGLRVWLEPEWGFAGYIELPSGLRTVFRNQHVNLNGSGSAEVASDKMQADLLLRMEGLQTVGGKAFFSPRWAARMNSDDSVDAALAYGRQLGWPVVVKPNQGTQGRGVEIAFSRRELRSAVRRVVESSRVFIVQRAIVGRDYRLVVLDGRVLSAYERSPLTVVGDGESSVSELVARLQESFIAAGRDTVIDREDPRVESTLLRCGMTIDSVPKAHERVPLLSNANLSSGGESQDVTGRVHPGFAQVARRAAGAIGLRLCGVDLMTEEGATLMEPPSAYSILEVNASPGLDNYAAAGAEQAERVRTLYAEVVAALVRGAGS